MPDGFVITTAGYAAAVQPLSLRLADPFGQTAMVH